MKKPGIILFDSGLVTSGHETFLKSFASRASQSRVNYIRFLLSVVCAIVLSVSPTYAQKTKGKSKQQLQSEITSLQKEISTANQLLKKTTKDKEMTLNEVSLLDKKIKQR